LEDEEYECIIEQVVQEYYQASFKPKLSLLDSSSLEDLIDALHAAYGRLQCHYKELVALQRYHSRLLDKIQKAQQVHSEELFLPVYAIELLQNPQRLIQHQQAIEKR
jgi:hypothetical protein